METGVVDLTQVVLSNGAAFIKPKEVCFLCGNTRGLKEPCAIEDCFCADKTGTRPVFHATCARQAGLEVKDDSSMATLFYGERKDIYSKIWTRLQLHDDL